MISRRYEGWRSSFYRFYFTITKFDIDVFLFGYTVYTAIMFIASMRIHGAMAFTFLTLFLGFVGLDFVFFAGMKSMLTITAIDLIFYACGALYMMLFLYFFMTMLFYMAVL